MFDKDYPPIPWSYRSDVAVKGGNDWRLCKQCQCAGREFRYDQWPPPRGTHSVRDGHHWSYEPGWQLRENVDWYATARWREYSASAYGGTYLTAGIKAMWHVFWYRVAIRKLDNDRPVPMWLIRIGAW